MNKADFVTAVADAAGLTKVDAAKAVEGVIRVVEKALKKGDQVRIAIRPERFSFAFEGKKANVLDCRIENITFLGSVVRVHILIGKSLFTMDTFNYPSLALPRIGAMDQVTCSREAVLVLNEDRSNGHVPSA